MNEISDDNMMEGVHKKFNIKIRDVHILLMPYGKLMFIYYNLVIITIFGDLFHV